MLNHYVKLLTSREREVLLLLVKGFSKKETAEELCVSINTVNAHVYNILLKFNVHSIRELLAFIIKELMERYENKCSLMTC